MNNYLAGFARASTFLSSNLVFPALHSNDSNGGSAAWARGIVIPCVGLAIGLGLMASAADAAPLAYVANREAHTVSVVDTGSNTVIATIPLGRQAVFIAVTPDGKRAYVTPYAFDTPASVIGTDPSDPDNYNQVVTTIPVGEVPYGVAITPDGKLAYIANLFSDSISVVDTSSNTVIETVSPVGGYPFNIAFTPDGKRVYVPNYVMNTVTVIDTDRSSPGYHTVVARIPIGGDRAFDISITPDGRRAYTTNIGGNFVAVIDTDPGSPLYNTVVATIGVGEFPHGISLTPDGKRAYVTEARSNNVSVIDTNPSDAAYNTVVATVPVGTYPTNVAISPTGRVAYASSYFADFVSVIDTDPSHTSTYNKVVATITTGSGASSTAFPSQPFYLFTSKLAVTFGLIPDTDSFSLNSSFTVRTDSNGINPVAEAVKLQVGSFATTIPAGSLKKNKQGYFTYDGTIGGAHVKVNIKPTGTLRYAFHASATGANMTGTTKPTTVTVTVGDDAGQITRVKF